MHGIKKITVPVLAAVCLLSVAVMIFTLCNPKQQAAEFVPPPFDSSAVAGVPDPPQDLGWSEIYQDGMSYKTGICGNVIVYDNKADVYFFNDASNTVWLKLRVLDEQGNILGETGLVKPNEYVQAVSFSQTPDDGEKVQLKIMAYAPETYYSEGPITLNTSVQIGG